jgi:hypothetical protein
MGMSSLPGWVRRNDIVAIKSDAPTEVECRFGLVEPSHRGTIGLAKERMRLSFRDPARDRKLVRSRAAPAVIQLTVRTIAGR